MSDVKPALRQAKYDLVIARDEARAKVQELMRTLTLAENDELDRLVAVAYRGGMSKSSIAAEIGESRVTVNERLARSGNPEPPAKTEAKPKTKAKIDEPEASPYSIDSDKRLRVEYNRYGPDFVKGQGEFEIVYDEDDDTYWFLVIDADETVADRLDTRFDGWYYEDARSFVAKALQGGE